jgi:hypothetical protein
MAPRSWRKVPEEKRSEEAGKRRRTLRDVKLKQQNRRKETPLKGERKMPGTKKRTACLI